MTPGEDAVETPYGDLWYVRGLHGELIPMYSSDLAEYAAIEAYNRGEFGALTTVEIGFMHDAFRSTPTPIHYSL